jgi:DNA-binding transcriptional MerR regulator
MVSGDSPGDLRPVDLARAAGISTASVRFYEREGFLPAADRRPSGHRAYHQIHLDALVTSRAMIEGYGWQYALNVMRDVHAGNLEHALELVDARHAAIDAERRNVRQTAAMLEALTEGDNATAPITSRAALRVGEAARMAGVTIPTLRFWEAEGLIRPGRDASNRYRLYGNDDLVQLRVIATLRNAGYGIPHIRGVIEELHRRDVAAALHEVRQRLEDLTTASHACLLATASLATYITRWCGDAGILSLRVGNGNMRGQTGKG